MTIALHVYILTTPLHTHNTTSSPHHYTPTTLHILTTPLHTHNTTSSPHHYTPTTLHTLTTPLHTHNTPHPHHSTPTTLHTLTTPLHTTLHTLTTPLHTHNTPHPHHHTHNTPHPHPQHHILTTPLHTHNTPHPHHSTTHPQHSTSLTGFTNFSYCFSTLSNSLPLSAMSRCSLNRCASIGIIQHSYEPNLLANLMSESVSTKIFRSMRSLSGLLWNVSIPSNRTTLAPYTGHCEVGGDEIPIWPIKHHQMCPCSLSDPLIRESFFLGYSLLSSLPCLTMSPNPY